MGKKDTDHTTTTINDNIYSKLFGHKVTAHSLNSDHNYQLCLQWCQRQPEQRQEKEEEAPQKVCSLLCFKHHVDHLAGASKTVALENLAPAQEPLAKKDECDDEKGLLSNDGKQLKDLLATYMTNPLKQYSIIIVNGTDLDTSKYMKSDEEKPKMMRTSGHKMHEINLGEKAEHVIKNAELMVNKTYKLSKDWVSTWCNNASDDTRSSSIYSQWINSSSYRDTLYIIKDRAVKIVDVAKGKYDNQNIFKDSKDDSDSDQKNSNNDNDKEGTDESSNKKDK